jgi:hypothetical protein
LVGPLPFHVWIAFPVPTNCQGVLGRASLLALLLALRQRFRWSPERPDQSATLAACLLAGVAATVFWQFAPMVLFTSYLEQRNSTLDSPAPQT